MRDVLQDLLTAVKAGIDVAFCQIVETRGSTPQKAGAAMLLRVDGSQSGTLGGGCVESEVRLRALRNIAAGSTTVETFQLDNDYGWDDGLICGGRMTVWVTAVPASSDVGYFRRLYEICEASQAATQMIALVKNEWDVTPGTSVLADGRGENVVCLGDAPSAAVLSHMLAQTRALDRRPRPYVLGGICYLPVLERCRLLIVGGGHVGRAVAELASRVDFDVWVYDDREDMISVERFPTAKQRVAGPIDEVLPAIEINASTYCLIVTRGHHHDEQALFLVAERGAGYVGMIGSRRKIRMILEDLRQEGIADEALRRVYAPVGLDIGSQTVDEIAISIVAELVAHRNCAGRIPGRVEAGVKSP